MQPNPPGCVKNQKNHKKSISDKDPLERVANRGFSHHKCLVGFPNGPHHPDLGSFATLKVGCVISLNLISEKNPLKRVANRGFSHHKCLVGFPNGPPHPDLGSFATLKVGCVISLNLISEKNPLKRVANR